MSDSTRIEKLREEVEKLCGNCDRPDKEELGEIILSSMALGFSEGLKTQSTDRPQGKWIKWEAPNGIDTGSKCSECSYHTKATPNYGTNFCPNCGADMRESN